MRHAGRLVLLTLVVACNASRAVAEERQLGVKSGASLSTLQRDRPTSEVPYDHRSGTTAGAYLVQPVRNRLAAQFEELFTENGGVLPFHQPNLIAGEMAIRYQFAYMDVPILARVNGPRICNERLHFLAGPTLSLRLNARQRTTFLLAGAAGFERDVTSEMDRTDFELTIGAGLEISRATFDVRYTHGLNNVLADLAGTGVGSRNILITGGFRFF
jgi:hypothetical protein